MTVDVETCRAEGRGDMSSCTRAAVSSKSMRDRLRDRGAADNVAGRVAIMLTELGLGMDDHSVRSVRPNTSRTIPRKRKASATRRGARRRVGVVEVVVVVDVATATEVSPVGGDVDGVASCSGVGIMEMRREGARDVPRATIGDGGGENVEGRGKKTL